MVIPEALQMILLVVGLILLMIFIRFFIVLERRMISLEQNVLKADEHIEQMVARVINQEKHSERLLYKKR